ncbi:unnamed protein product [Cochlearia groenlandica]
MNSKRETRHSQHENRIEDQPPSISFKLLQRALAQFIAFLRVGLRQELTMRLSVQIVGLARSELGRLYRLSIHPGYHRAFRHQRVEKVLHTNENGFFRLIHPTDKGGTRLQHKPSTQGVWPLAGEVTHNGERLEDQFKEKVESLYGKTIHSPWERQVAEVAAFLSQSEFTPHLHLREGKRIALLSIADKHVAEAADPNPRAEEKLLGTHITDAEVL